MVPGHRRENNVPRTERLIDHPAAWYRDLRASTLRRLFILVFIISLYLADGLTFLDAELFESLESGNTQMRSICPLPIWRPLWKSMFQCVKINIYKNKKKSKKYPLLSLWDRFWRISLYCTVCGWWRYCNALCDVKFSQIEGNGGKFHHKS